MKKFTLFLFLGLFVFSGYCQSTLTLKSEGKVRKTDSPLSEIIGLIPAGTQVKVISLNEGYYKIEYKGKIGYLSELYFQASGASKSNRGSASTSSDNGSSKKVWNEFSLQSHWKENGIDVIEGIYEQIVSSYEKNAGSASYKLGLKKMGSAYELIYLAGATNEFKHKWSPGDRKALLSPTATKNLFKVKWYMGDKTVNDGLYISFEAGIMNVIWTDGHTDTYLKLYPTAGDDIAQSIGSSKQSSGTGFAISSNGIIVTNFHVIDGSTTIKVRGINADFSRQFTAKLLVADKNNDLAIIQINDPSFTSFGTVPFIINTTLAGVGENIFVLGYPLRATMGDEIKLTNGIVSSRTGFQGDVTSYQISAPVQPGNSGGPLFDSKGNLIGIINAKHAGAENASYAVKSTYLMNLIELLAAPYKLQTVNSMAGKTLTQQVELVRKFIFIIETQ